MKHLIAFVMSLFLLGCTINVNYPEGHNAIPEINVAAPDITVTIPEAATQTIVDERVVYKYCKLESLERLLLLDEPDEELYKSTGDWQGYGTALDKYMKQVKDLKIQIQLERLKCED